MFERSKKGEHALLIQPHSGPLDDGVAEEFTELARSAGATIAGLINARLGRPNPSTLIGIAHNIMSKDLQLYIFINKI